MAAQISIEDVRKAQEALRSYIDPTPLIKNPWLSEIYGCQIYLKLETAQPIGSFKVRGATHKLLSLSEVEREKGLIASSAGNHGQGVAWASRQLGLDALIVMPNTAPIVKVQNVKSLGAHVHLEGNNYDEAFQAARRIEKETGRVFIHPFNDDVVIRGQATMGLEIAEQLKEPDYVVGSMGGGGMMTGVASVLGQLSPKTRIIGCQAEGASALVESLRTGKVIEKNEVHTFADGVAVSRAEERMVNLLKGLIHETYLAKEESIAAAVLVLMEKAKVVVEGSGALPLAILDQIRNEIKDKKVVLILSGGNIDVNLLSRIIEMGLVRTGRRLRLNVVMSDRPGSLSKLADLIARQGASIHQAIHDRNRLSTNMDEAEVELTLETRGHEHGKQVIAAIDRELIRLEVLT